mmetsp:Transcript_21516/g.51342  ORF Transcript_21516/g.51342 Transcript_21516/m.51342 type:complete len:291 (-) Transcript_21516:933-1805(-)
MGDLLVGAHRVALLQAVPQLVQGDVAAVVRVELLEVRAQRLELVRLDELRHHEGRHLLEPVGLGKLLEVLEQLRARQRREAPPEHDVAERLEVQHALRLARALRELLHQVPHHVHADVDVAPPKGAAELLGRHKAVPVLVEEVEDVVEGLRGEDGAPVDGGRDELLVADGPGLPHIERAHKVVDLRAVDAEACRLEALAELLEGDLPVLVHVKGLKGLLEAGDALRHEAIGSDVEHEPLEPRRLGEVVEPPHEPVIEEVDHVVGAGHPYPRVLQRLRGGEALGDVPVQDL